MAGYKEGRRYRPHTALGLPRQKATLIPGSKLPPENAYQRLARVRQPQKAEDTYDDHLTDHGITVDQKGGDPTDDRCFDQV